MGHVEAGLRTYNIYSTYPEKFNRQTVGIVSQYNFSLTELSKQNLLNQGQRPEGIAVGPLKLVGTEEDTVYRNFMLLDNEEKYAKMSNASNPCGDGFACKRIADILSR